MNPPEQTAAAPMPENTTIEELMVDEVVEGKKLKIILDLYFWFVGHLVEVYVSIAESLGLREPALKWTHKRVRWTCVCGCRLYDDFFEFTPGAVRSLQRHLDDSDPQLIRRLRSTYPSVPDESNPNAAPNRFEKAEGPERDSVRERQSESIYDKLRNFDLDILRRNPTQAPTLWLSHMICDAGYPWKEQISAFDLLNRKNSPDTELFIRIRKWYFESKGTFSWLLSPQRLTTIRTAFMPDPFHMGPIIGPNYLMHLWQNPHHTDWHTYQKNKSVSDKARCVMRKLLDLARTHNIGEGRLSENSDDTLAGNELRQSETEQQLFRRSYIFHMMPKKLAVKPDPKAIKPGALYLEEDFQFRHFIVLVVAIIEVTMSGLVLGVHFGYVAGLQGLELYLRLLWISSWLTGLSTVIITLWFRSRGYACSWFIGRFWQEGS